MIHTFLQANHFQRFDSQFMSRLTINSTIDQRQFYIFNCIQICNKIKSLKDKSDPLSRSLVIFGDFEKDFVIGASPAA